ncbi:MAG: ABC transporter ATP-binding protein [Erysipelotrichales bacterium]|nr:ABC transporter ATP-binding protein [Erysipelotrichales bacterium]
MLKIINFSKNYPNGKVGAKNINLEIKAGDLYAFIGHNGAGKTTTIKAIVGIHDLTSGDILMDEISVVKNPMEVKKRLAYIPDNPDVYTALTGMQYLSFIANIFKVNKETFKALTEKYAADFELTKDLNNPISSYSHGMRQKIVLISALIHQPKLLILDEPFVGLDPKAAFTLKTIMKEHCEKGGAIFFSTHVLDVAEKLCNKVAIIKAGEIIADGLMDDIKKDSSLEAIFLENSNA